MSEALAQRRIVDDALQRVRGTGTNTWEVVFPLPMLGAIGFALERPLYDYLMSPEGVAMPRGAAAFCVFHRNYKPAAAHRRLWQIEKERFSAYSDDHQNGLLRPAEDAIGGRPRILYARAMEFGVMTLLATLGYEVSALSGAGKKQSGIDIVGVRVDPEEESADQALAVECKTTALGFEKRSLRTLFNGVMASLKKSRDHDAVCALHPRINANGGTFDYLIATNREFKSPQFREREGYFLLRGIEVG